MTPSEVRRHLQWMLIHYGPARDVTVETSNGRITFPSHQWLPGKYLYVKRSYEEKEAEDVVELLRAQGYVGRNGATRTVLNIGANIGMTCIALLKHSYFDRAIAIEPASDNFRLLLRNIEQNGLSGRILPSQCAVSAISGWLDMELSPDNPGDHRIRLTETPGFYREEKRKTVQVQARALDDLLAEEPLTSAPSIDLVWIDIQGHEGHLFKGARKFFARGIPAVSEFWPYGIERSGISKEEYCSILGGLFTSFYVVGSEPVRRQPIADFARLFETHSGPRAIALVVLLPPNAS